MSVDGTDYAIPKHFGSEYAMVDYENKAHNFYLNINIAPIEKLQMHGSINYNLSKASLDEVIMPDITTREGFDLYHQDFGFEHMHEYSDLDFELLTLGAGFEYLLAAGLTFTVDVTYADLKDNAAYVYGDESGSYLAVLTGFRFDF